jgi:hypothetical protein
VKALAEATKIAKCFAVYGGAERLRDGPLTVLPVIDFMRELASGAVLPGSA